MKKSQIYIIENYTKQLFAITGLNEITIKEFEHRSYIVGVSEGGTAIIANIEFNIGNIDDIKKVKDYLSRYGLNFEVIKESDFRKITSINTVKLTKVKNPFFEWVDSNVKFTMNLPSKKTLGNPLQSFYIPSDDVLDKIYEWLGLNYDKLSNLRNVQIAKAFAYLWHSSNFNEFDIEIEDSFLVTPDAKIPIVSTTIVSKTTHRDYKIIYIGGFLSLPHLTKILQQYQIFPNDLNNPFRKFKGMNFYPDISIVQSLFDKFKVINIDKLLPYESDYKMIFPDQKANIDQVYRQHFADGEVIPIVNFTGTINYLERLPINVMKRLEQLVENRKGARGDIKDISKDLLSVIINGNLKGKDLISLCESNAMIGKKCDSDDQAIFKRALKHEFNITFENGLYDYESAKDMYIQAYDLAYVLTYKGVKLQSVEVFRPSAFQLEKNQVVFIPSKEFAENKNELDGKMFVNFHENPSLVFMYAELSEEYIVSNQIFKNQIDNEPYFELFIEYINMLYQLSESSTIDLNSLKRFWFESTKIDCIKIHNY